MGLDRAVFSRMHGYGSSDDVRAGEGRDAVVVG